MTTLTLKNQQTRDADRRRVETEAETFFADLYGEQAAANMALLDDGTDGLESRIRELYQDVPATTAASYFDFWLPIALALGAGALEGYKPTPKFNNNMTRYLRRMSELFGDTYSENSLRMTFEAITRWRDTEGATVGDLRESLATVWEGPRPSAAATTETTRIVNQSWATAWQDADTWGFNIRTANDGRVSEGGRVRDHHQDVADNGPYPWSRYAEFELPLFGDVNCRCWLSPVVRDPNG